MHACIQARVQHPSGIPVDTLLPRALIPVDTHTTHPERVWQPLSKRRRIASHTNFPSQYSKVTVLTAPPA